MRHQQFFLLSTMSQHIENTITSLIILEKIQPFSPENAQKNSLKSLQHSTSRNLMLLAATKMLGIEGVIQEDCPPLVYRKDKTPAPLRFSISHRKHWVGCLASTSSCVGFDLEIHKNRDFLTHLDDLLNSQEKAFLAHNNHSDSSAEELFYKCWTLKEALGKFHKQGWNTSNENLDLMLASKNSELLLEHIYLQKYNLSIAYAIKKNGLISNPEIIIINT
ncbi:MAG: 4'-phosphopantetheinyl transferase superfamily protein [Pseudomonadota bacterium]